MPTGTYTLYHPYSQSYMHPHTHIHRHWKEAAISPSSSRSHTAPACHPPASFLQFSLVFLHIFFYKIFTFTSATCYFVVWQLLMVQTSLLRHWEFPWCGTIKASRHDYRHLLFSSWTLWTLHVTPTMKSAQADPPALMTGGGDDKSFSSCSGQTELGCSSSSVTLTTHLSEMTRLLGDIHALDQISENFFSETYSTKQPPLPPPAAEPQAVTEQFPLLSYVFKSCLQKEDAKPLLQMECR